MTLFTDFFSKAIRFGLLFVSLILSNSAFSHGRYILPSHTVLSGEDAATVTLTASISNDIFHADRPFGDDGNGNSPKELSELFDLLDYQITEPTGKKKTVVWHARSRLSVADIVMPVEGTYRISTIQPITYMTTFQHEDGTPGRVFGRNPVLPSGAEKIVRRTYHARTETFVSYNKPSVMTFEPQGQGLEIGGSSHPNDLFVNELTTFNMYLDGKPLTQAATVSLTRSGTRHRNQRGSQTYHTNSNGELQICFDQPGFYLLEAAVETKAAANSDVDVNSYHLYLTLEVFPE